VSRNAQTGGGRLLRILLIREHQVSARAARKGLLYVASRPNDA